MQSDLVTQNVFHHTVDFMTILAPWLCGCKLVWFKAAAPRLYQVGHSSASTVLTAFEVVFEDAHHCMAWLVVIACKA
jgi:hypothetical protein